ncbi:MAG: DUF4383 domain-containing protein [Pyrinomonadaceae bacterium]
MAKTVAKIMGVVFILAGVVGFVNNDLMGFHLTPFHNAGVHIVSGVIALYFGFSGTLRGARLFDIIFGVVYAGLGVLGFLAGGHQGHLSAGVPGPDDAYILKVLPSMLELGKSDHMLHIVLGLVFLIGGLMTSSDRT